ncbi:hypothetical protein CP532_6241 [Ophiocordyceps camponoti-leonardi (nom. inval.)]|nr:hypothetical protein CP532_6241 [Ophiocordyceps camponoti-leonardi (nom. inval.)]
MFTLLSVFSYALVVASGGASALSDTNCKCYPGDDCWPHADVWAQLNETVGGRLVATIPLGSPCHDPHYDEGLCSSLRRRWHDPAVHHASPPSATTIDDEYCCSIASSSSLMVPLFANGSCDPFSPRNTACEVGSYVRYAVDARDAHDVVATIRFARKHNIRLVIRNTGHDFLGRSTGAGGLALRTQHLKETRVLDWDDKRYVGKALRAGAGIWGFEANEAAKKAGLVVVTGECPTVGMAGGYIQGGGHSTLSSAFGLGADNTLSFEVVTPSGEIVTASPSNRHRDLYWALSGGGGGNFGVVISVTVKAHPDVRVGGANFQVTAPRGRDGDVMQHVWGALHSVLPTMVDAGLTLVYVAYGTSFRGVAVTGYNMTEAQVRLAMMPLEAAVKSKGLILQANFTEFPSYQQHAAHYFGTPSNDSFGVNNALFGGHLYPRSALANLTEASREVNKKGGTLYGVALDVSRFGAGSSNAVLPQWRQTIVHLAVSLPLMDGASMDYLKERQHKMTYELQPLLEAAAPGAGAYMNEADFQQPNFQEVFFGANYPRLMKIKRRYDGRGLLYVTAGVGSEDWTVGQDGRMCRAHRLGTNSDRDA